MVDRVAGTATNLLRLIFVNHAELLLGGQVELPFLQPEPVQHGLVESFDLNAGSWLARDEHAEIRVLLRAELSCGQGKSGEVRPKRLTYAGSKLGIGCGTNRL